MVSARKALGQLNWFFIVTMAALALARPLTMVLQTQLQLPIPRIVPIAITVAITFTWVLLASILKINNPILALLLVGVIYSVLSLALGALVATSLGEADGGLDSVTTAFRVLGWNAVWGLVAGAAAQGLMLIVAASRAHSPSEPATESSEGEAK